MSTPVRLKEVVDIVVSMELWKNMEGLSIRGSDNISALSDHVAMNPRHNFVAISGDQLIGTVLGRFDGRRGYIYHLAVHPDFRKQNIGNELMERCFQSFRDIHVTKCHMMVLRDSVTIKIINAIKALRNISHSLNSEKRGLMSFKELIKNSVKEFVWETN